MTRAVDQFRQSHGLQTDRPQDQMSTEQLKQFLLIPPSADEVVRRQALVARIKEARRERMIAPLTTTDLVHQARMSEHESDGGER